MIDWGSCVVNGTATLQCLPIVLANFLDGLFMFAGTVAVIIIMIAGFRFILAGGDSKQLDTARKTIVYAVAGLLLILLSSLIINLIAQIIGVTCIFSVWPFSFTSCVGS